MNGIKVYKQDGHCLNKVFFWVIIQDPLQNYNDDGHSKDYDIPSRVGTRDKKRS